MNSTALGAVSKNKQSIKFISEAHEKFYYEKLKEVRYQDLYGHRRGQGSTGGEYCRRYTKRQYGVSE